VGTILFYRGFDSITSYSQNVSSDTLMLLSRQLDQDTSIQY